MTSTLTEETLLKFDALLTAQEKKLKPPGA